VVGICNGIDTNRFRPDVRDMSIRRGAPQVVAILGHISEVKGHPDFVEAAGLIADEFPGLRFVVIGGETLQTGLRQALEERVRALGLTDRFEFTGFRHDVPALISAVDLVVLPSRSEGLPLAALETMACGRPLIATPVGGVPEAVIDNETGVLIPPADAGALAAAMTRLLRNPALATQLGLAGLNRIRGRFTIQAFAESVQALYSRVQ
jgi:glycosyltransferase involved in cell wall biosynthesis